MNCYSFIQGEKLQFIFRDINQKDSECVYTFMLRISEGGLYQSEYSKQNRTVTNGFGNQECYHEWLEMSQPYFWSTVVSSDPPLDCMAHLEQRLQETNNFSAFLANVRREFLALKPEQLKKRMWICLYFNIFQSHPVCFVSNIVCNINVFII